MRSRKKDFIMSSLPYICSRKLIDGMDKGSKKTFFIHLTCTERFYYFDLVEFYYQTVDENAIVVVISLLFIFPMVFSWVKSLSKRYMAKGILNIIKLLNINSYIGAFTIYPLMRQGSNLFSAFLSHGGGSRPINAVMAETGYSFLLITLLFGTVILAAPTNKISFPSITMSKEIIFTIIIFAVVFSYGKSTKLEFELVWILFLIYIVYFVISIFCALTDSARQKQINGYALSNDDFENEEDDDDQNFDQKEDTLSAMNMNNTKDQHLSIANPEEIKNSALYQSQKISNRGIDNSQKIIERSSENSPKKNPDRSPGKVTEQEPIVFKKMEIDEEEEQKTALMKIIEEIKLDFNDDEESMTMSVLNFPIKLFGLFSICYESNPLMKTKLKNVVVCCSVFLAVTSITSGVFKHLYVGIISVLISFLLSFLNSKKKGERISKSAILMFSLLAAIFIISMIVRMFYDLTEFVIFYFNIESFINDMLISVLLRSLNEIYELTSLSAMGHPALASLCFFSIQNFNMTINLGLIFLSNLIANNTNFDIFNISDASKVVTVDSLKSKIFIICITSVVVIELSTLTYFYLKNFHVDRLAGYGFIVLYAAFVIPAAILGSV